MIPIKFPEYNKELQKPSSMTDDECKPLLVFTDGKQCVSLWKMSWKERLHALFHGTVWLQVVSGITQPPVALSAQKTIFEIKQ